MIKVIKRDCTLEDFNKVNIYNAIIKAMPTGNGVKENIAEKIANEIEEELKEKEEIEISEIESMVFDKLIKYKQRNTARQYEGYRSIREFQRECDNSIDKDLNELLSGESKYWTKENSNKNSKVANVQRDYMAGIVSTDITRRKLLPPNIVQAHDEGILHFHDADYFGMKAIHNCFHKKTKLLTTDGIKSFEQFRDGEKIQVFDKDGIIREATVKCYGKQQMQKVVIATQHRTKEIICTKNHRWLLSNGDVTTNLNVGDSLIGLKDNTTNLADVSSYRQKEMFTLGFVIGGGCDHTPYTQVRLCGKKNKYKNIFLDCGYSESVINKTDDVLMTKIGTIKQNFLNGQSWKYLSNEDKKFLFYGFYCADGAENSNRVATTDDRVAQMIRDISYFGGYYITSESTQIRDTEFKSDSELLTFRFSVSQPQNMLWKVKSIEPYNSTHTYSAWCVEEPITHSFTLDGGVITGNCCLINLDDMLQNGTVINKVHISKPQSFSTACNVATQIITGVASSQYGGTSISLTHLAPFVRTSKERLIKEEKENHPIISKLFKKRFNKIIDKKLRKEINKGVEIFNYQVNSMSTTNGQAPFITVFMYLGETEEYKEELAMIIEEFLNQRIEGLPNEVGVYVTQAFPKLIYVLEEDNIHEDSKYWYLTELSAKCTAKRLVPDYISEKKMKELKDGYCFPSMGCRSFLAPSCGDKFYGRFNEGVVTLNLVDVAYSSEKDFDKFWELMEQRTELCHKALRCRHERLWDTLSDVAPILWQDGALARLGKHEPINSLLNAEYSSISLGYAGLYECVKYMTSESHSNGGHDFGIQVMKFLNDKCDKWKAEENLGYSLYGSPIESTTYKFAKCLKKRFGDDIFIELDGKDRDYITNSYHIPVFEEIDPFEKLYIESEFQSYSLGGSISYVECADLTQNTNAVLNIMKFIYNNIMYAELNTKSDYCQVCGYDGEIKIIDENNKLIWECPNCGNRDQDKMNVARRTCGYIGANFWNEGRTDEIAHRYIHCDNHNM